MRVVGWLRKLDEDGHLVEPAEFAEVEAEAADYATARKLAEAKLPASGWKLLAWKVPDHLPG